MSVAKRVAVRNVNVPGYRSTVDAEKYGAMRKVLLQVLPKAAPGLTQNEMLEAVTPRLPQALWPGGDKAMWWLKTVQLDLEAKGMLKRVATKPLRWHVGRTGPNRQWHARNRMPAGPTDRQRIAWHIEHERQCGCRPIPAGVVELMRARKTPARSRRVN